MNYPLSIQKLIDLFSKFPTVGPRTASRFVFYLAGKSKEEVDKLAAAIVDLKKNVKSCRLCFNPFEPTQVSSSPAKVSEKFRRAGFGAGEGEGELCEICSNPTRDKSLLCIVEKEIDLLSIEKTKKYKGLYFILGGQFSKLKKAALEKFTQLNSAKGNLTGLRTKELEERIKSHPEIKEIIIALNSTTEGEATTLYLERLLKPFNKKITRLGRGLPVGGELEYADEETLSSALEGRR